MALAVGIFPALPSPAGCKLHISPASSQNQNLTNSTHKLLSIPRIPLKEMSPANQSLDVAMQGAFGLFAILNFVATILALHTQQSLGARWFRQTRDRAWCRSRGEELNQAELGLVRRPIRWWRDKILNTKILLPYYYRILAKLLTITYSTSE